jgi:hypothetical protein
VALPRVDRSLAKILGGLLSNFQAISNVDAVLEDEYQRLGDPSGKVRRPLEGTVVEGPMMITHMQNSGKKTRCSPLGRDNSSLPKDQ